MHVARAIATSATQGLVRLRVAIAVALVAAIGLVFVVPTAGATTSCIFVKVVSRYAWGATFCFVLDVGRPASASALCASKHQPKSILTSFGVVGGVVASGSAPSARQHRLLETP